MLLSPRFRRMSMIPLGAIILTSTAFIMTATFVIVNEMMTSRNDAFAQRGGRFNDDDYGDDDDGGFGGRRDGGGGFFGRDDDDDGGLEDLSPRERREMLKEETDGLNFFEKIKVREEFDRELKEGRAEDQIDRESNRLEDLYERGRINERQYDEQMARYREGAYRRNGLGGNIFSVDEANKDLNSAKASLDAAMRRGEIDRYERDDLLDEIRGSLYDRAGTSMSPEERRLIRAAANDWARGNFSDIGIDEDQIYEDIGDLINQQVISEEEKRWRREAIDDFHGDHQGLNGEQVKVLADYAKNGDRPLEADKGRIPRANPVLADAQIVDVTSAERLSKAILQQVKDDVARLQNGLPEGCRVQDGLALLETLKQSDSDKSLVDNLQGALIDRDIRRFERNAEALSIPKAEIQRILVGISLENLQDKLEDDASVVEIRKVTEPMVSRIEGAALDEGFSIAFLEWLRFIPDLLKVREEMLANAKSGAKPAWPNGDVKIVYDPFMTPGEVRYLSNDILISGIDPTTGVGLGTGNKYTANGLPIFQGDAGETAAASLPVVPAKPETPKLFLEYPGGTGPALKYVITGYQNVPLQDKPGQTQAVKKWSKEYSIKPGLKQPLALSWGGTSWYRIDCQTVDGSGKAKAYSLKPKPGYSPTYQFKVDTKSKVVTLMTKKESITLDNSLSSRPFHFLLGDEHHTVRPGAKVFFNSGVTLKYANNARAEETETKPATKPAAGKPVATAKTPSANDIAASENIATLTLRDEAIGLIGINFKGNWEIRTQGEMLVADHRYVDLPVPTLVGIKEKVETTIAGPAPTRGNLYVVAVGISSYRNPEDFPALSYADKDAKVLSGILQQQKDLFSEVKSFVLTNEDATAIKIRAQLASLKREVTKNDTVALIFAGHGVVDKNVYYFCPQDAKVAELKRKGISCDELRQITSELSARNVFVMLDSCQSGGATDKFRQGFEEQIQRYGASGVVVFASSKNNETSQENQSWGHGALTKAFLDTLSDLTLDKNNDSIVQVAELDIGLTEGVKKLTDGGQHVQSVEMGKIIRNLSLVKYNENQ